ncbi:uncharacterized protein N7483_002436 [Penicillium malachiteum]|uniref:uncharacterized protein n=1 Tax=Penicillium malachiteum TaxID=1324776 RepID=UPI002547F41B|nr:uncharacterized protein N7483_002436 [Penicillium malachiteum]KAJ5737311.1 hypothetical protein N7483_002436 [Penicillium malachiteum]
MDQDIEDEDVVVPLRLISSIICFKIVEATKTYFVEAIATVNEAKIKERLPWVFNGYKPIKVDQGLDSRIICGITATWNATSGQKLDVRQISDAQPSVNSETEVDLHIGLWVERGVVEKLAPSLLDKRGWSEVDGAVIVTVTAATTA